MPDEIHTASRLDTLVKRARLIIGFERLWPAVVLFGVVCAGFAACSWMGLWLVVPAWARMAGVTAFGVALIASVLLAVRIGRVSRTEALARLDRDSGQKHRPVSASQDRLADGDADPVTRALWEAHRLRQARAMDRVRLAAPSPRLVDRDRYAVRAMAVLAAVAAAFVAGTDQSGRLASAFDWRSHAEGASAFRLDAWIDPPPYTGRAPVLLSGLAASVAADPAQPISAPMTSIVVVRSAGAGAVTVEAEGGLTKAAASARPGAASGSATEAAATERTGTDQRYTLAGDGRLTVTHDGQRIARFVIHAVPDLPPVVTVLDRPTANLRGSLTLKYKIEDDYGVIGAEAAFSNPVLDGKPVTGRTLVEPPKLTLTLPNGARGLGPGQTTADLSDHPWAGAEVTLVIGARDEGGNTGTSAPVTMTLPARAFRQPLARALVEQRRNLVLDPDHHERVGLALDALRDAPELFGTTPALYLGLGAAMTRLAGAKTDADLLGVADLLWSMALSIEDGDLSQTERDLRALQRELHDAIARNAPPEEINKLTQALKEQLEKYLAEMAQRNNDADASAPVDRNAKTVSPKDLQSLLDRMQQSARNGDVAEAQRLLDQLQNILENLKSAQRGQGQNGQQQMNRSMNALDKMMRDQQALRDKTFKRGNQQRPGQRGQSPDGDQDQSGEDPQAGDPSGQPQAQDGQDNADLEQQQQALRQQLEQLQKQMKDLGLNGEKGFEEAQQAMKDAEQALGDGKRGNDRAVDAQGRALQGLQQGSRGLQGQMAQGQGQGEGQQPGETGMGRSDGTADGTEPDPLNRSRNANDMTGLDAGQGLAERARQVLEELRRRLGDRLRPQEEKDYLERLLRRY